MMLYFVPQGNEKLSVFPLKKSTKHKCQCNRMLKFLKKWSLNFYFAKKRPKYKSWLQMQID